MMPTHPNSNPSLTNLARLDIATYDSLGSARSRLCRCDDRDHLYNFVRYEQYEWIVESPWQVCRRESHSSERLGCRNDEDSWFIHSFIHCLHFIHSMVFAQDLSRFLLFFSQLGFRVWDVGGLLKSPGCTQDPIRTDRFCRAIRSNGPILEGNYCIFVFPNKHTHF